MNGLLQDFDAGVLESDYLNCLSDDSTTDSDSFSNFDDNSTITNLNGNLFDVYPNVPQILRNEFPNPIPTDLSKTVNYETPIETQVKKPAPRKKKPKKKKKTPAKKKTSKRSRKRKRSDISKEEDSELDKEELRRIKNRESARASRERRKKYISDLESNNQRLNKDNNCLLDENRTLLGENRCLREEISRLREFNIHQYQTLNNIKKKKGFCEQSLNLESTETENDLQPLSKRRKVYYSEMKPVNFTKPLPNGTQQSQQHQQQNMYNINPFSSQFWQMVLPKSTGKKAVIMFMVVFCVAFFITIPNRNTGKSSLGGRVISVEEKINKIKNVYVDYEKQFDFINGEEKEISFQKIMEILNVHIDNNKTHIFMEVPHNLEPKIKRRTRRNLTETVTFEKFTQNLFVDVCSFMFEEVDK